MTYKHPRNAKKNKLAIVTGAGSGIGLATAWALAKSGFTVALLGRNCETLETNVSAILRARHRAFAVKCDVRKESSVRESIDEITAHKEKLYILVNNAGIAARAALIHETDTEIWDDLLATNLTGPFQMSRYVLPYFIRNGAGVIINVSSIAGLITIPYLGAYGITKSGLITLTKSIASEYGNSGIRCNCVCPGTVNTSMTKEFIENKERKTRLEESIPLNRVAEPDDVAKCIRFLCSEEARYVSGSVLTADGGYSVGGR